MGIIEVKNVVTDYGVNNINYGGDPTHNTTRIQGALDDAEADGGGIVYFPAGKYLINGTLKLPNRVKLLGFSGTTFGVLQNEIGNPNFLTDPTLSPATVIKMDSESNVNMIEPKGLYSVENNILFQAEIENFIFWGNKENQKIGSCIYLADLNEDNFATRGHLRFRNLLIYQFKETGFYGGAGHHELYIDEVVSFGNENDGFVLFGQDIKASRIQSAANGGAGIKILGKDDPINPGFSASGAGRFYDVDCWSNDVGIDILDTMNLFFFGLSSNINRKFGIHIHPGNSERSFSPTQIHVFRGTFDGNNICDLKVSSPAPKFGPSNILLDGCMFRGGEGTPPYHKPDYAIIDDSYKPARNIISNCFIKRTNYTNGIINNIGIYSFRNCYDYDTRRVLDEINVPYNYIDADYDLLPSDAYITVGTSTGNRTIKLPILLDSQLGKLFFISKSDAHPYSVNVVPSSGDSIQGTTLITQAFETLMIVNAGANWYSIKIS